MKNLFYLLFWPSILVAQPAELVLTNGNIITIASKGHRAEAVAIRDDRLLAIGTKTDVQPFVGPNTRVIDLQGKTVVPGFNDAHLHPRPIFPFESPHATVELGPDSVRTMDELVAQLARKVSLTPNGWPIQGIGYQDTKLGRHPTRQDLDRVSRTHPVIIRHSSGHISVVNSYVMERAGLSAKTPDPAGGAFDRDSLGVPNGVCRESALSQVLQRANLQQATPPSEVETLEAYNRCFQRYLANGITSITEAVRHSSKWRCMKNCRQLVYPFVSICYCH